MEWNEEQFKLSEELMDTVQEFPHDKVGITFTSNDYDREIGDPPKF
jgi:hypothetical protein